MEITVLNANLESVGIVDAFESLIWTDRYYGFGDFEIQVVPSISLLSTMYSGSYLTLRESEHIMLVDTLNIKTDIENGNKMLIKGKSLEFILNRRIIWNQTVLNGNFQDGIHQLLTENAITPTDTNRDITRLEFEASTDPLITALTVEGQFFGDNLYKAILDLCVSKSVGFKITLTSTGNFKFKLYAGVDRSYSQSTNTYVIFSPSLENLVNSDYMTTDSLLRTVSLVAGEKGVGNVRRTVTVAAPGGAGTNLARREMFTDASGVSRSVPDLPGGELTDEQYLAQIQQKGAEDLAKNTEIEVFDAQADTTHLYSYGEDFFIGDILQISDEYGHESRSRVIEMIHSEDLAGIKTYPTFNTLT